eukprot:CAMPEP_0176002470 /NCGR_PEP_ID=MMETSP0120_2-20121206/663_1 /TAXON_ID=160619 /ORGANISM="Kryptoperidinium foliaceum, Strain CCMP 1326" /LENGTH=249 /DNA_ID=CAMNT_0017335059 /DNA_START=156 /DNA_END=905 /DNA_ORIENTATION=-
MKEDYDVDPNVFSYSIVLEAMSQQSKNNPELPDRARAILDAMPPVPNARPFTAVIRAYAEQGRGQDAESLLEDMISTPTFPQPDVYSFAAALLAWSRVKKGEDFTSAAKRSEDLIARMNKLYYSGKIRDPPNSICFSNVLKAWSRVHNVQGAKRADAILEAMESHGIRPNLFCYNIVINAWSNHTLQDIRALERVEALMECARRLGPDEYTYRAFFKAVCNSSLDNRDEVAIGIVREMQERGIRVKRGR